jgi:hypothetical protein
MDDLHWFFRGFYTKRVAGVHKLSEVGDMLLLYAPFSVRRAETLCEKKNLQKVSACDSDCMYLIALAPSRHRTQTVSDL